MSITNKLTYLEDTKTQIKEAIKAKGVEVSDNDTFRSYASKIGDIQTGGGSGDCVAGVCFDDIGYTTTPQYMVDGVAYALQIKDTWDASVTSRKFTNDTNLMYFPQVDVSNFTDVRSMFSGCGLLQYIPLLNMTSITNSISSMFYNCASLPSLDLSSWDVSSVTNMNSMLNRCWSLTSLDLTGWDTGNVTDMGSIISGCELLEKVDGVLDITSCNYSDGYNYFPGYSRVQKLRKLTFKNLGYQSGKTGINFSFIENWGVNNDTITDARQSLIDSLVTYTFDRATAGYSTHTITLSANTKAVLTQEEIAQITAKGYTIA